MLPTVRGHNEGTLWYRKRDRRWVAQVSMPDGTRPSASSRDKAEARVLLADLIRRRAQHQPVSDRNLTLGQYLARWLVDVKPNVAPATWRKHESIARVHLVPALGRVGLRQLSAGDVRGYLRGKQGCSPQTLRHHRATLRRALADAIGDGHIEANVAAQAKAPKLTPKERTILTAGQVRTLIEGTRDDRHHALWVLAATTGMREAEMLGLTWDDVQLDQPFVSSVPTKGSVHVRHTLHRGDGWELRPPKTPKSRRTIPLPSVTVDALREHWRRQQAERAKAGRMGREGMVFTTEKGQPIHGPNLLPPFYAALARLGLPRVTIHDLRHSAATILYANGVPLAVIADILGHSTIRVTADLYRHRVPELSEEAALKMQEAVG